MPFVLGLVAVCVCVWWRWYPFDKINTFLTAIHIQGLWLARIFIKCKFPVWIQNGIECWCWFGLMFRWFRNIDSKNAAKLYGNCSLQGYTNTNIPHNTCAFIYMRKRCIYGVVCIYANQFDGRIKSQQSLWILIYRNGF